MKVNQFYFSPARTIQSVIIIGALFLLTSCSSLLNSFVIEPTVSNLQKQTDFQLVCEGGASYLLMIDSLIESDRNDSKMLILGAKAYSAYLAALSECGANGARLNTIASKGRLYGKKLLHNILPIEPGESLELLDKALDTLATKDIEQVFWGAAAWTQWIYQQQGSPAAMADLVKIEKIMLRLVELDETYGDGAIQLILGSYYGSKPEILGGKPVLARKYFERGLDLSKRRYLPLQAAYAETYCRMTMNSQLHEDLLQEVISFPLEKAPEFTLVNQVAKAKAQKLLQENFFDE